jgi:hypothetical protein
MFKLTALLTTLALGASGSIALASPDRPFDQRHDERARVDGMRFARDRDHFDRPDQPYAWSRGRIDDFGPRRYRPTWVALSAPLRLGRMGRDAIEVTDRGTFTQLRLQSLGGFARVDRVIIEFANGSRQVAHLERVLDARGELLEIQLDGNNRRIDRITVVGTTGRRGALEVFGI